MTTTTWREHRTRVGLLAFLLLGMALRAWNLDGQSLWRDEVDTVRFATQPLPDLLSMFITPGHNGALYYLLMRPWIALFGHQDYALRYSSLLVGLLSIPLTFHVVKRWAGTRPAWVAALLLTASPYLIWYSQELRMYALVLTVVLLATLCWQRAYWEGHPRYWIPYVLLISAGIYLHFLVALLIPTHVILSLLFPRLLRRRWRGWVLAYAFFVLPYIPLAWWQKKLLFSPTFRTGHPFVPLPQMFLKLLTVFSVGIHLISMPDGVPAHMRIVPLLFLALLGLIFASRNARPAPAPSLARRASLALWFILPIVGLYLISLELPLFTERYMIWTAPALYALAGLGAWALARWRPASLAALGLVLTLFVLGTGYQVRHPIKPDMRAVVQYVESQRAPDSVVLLHLGYLIHAYTYYAPDARPHLREAPAPGPQGSLDQTGQDILIRLEGARDVWLVESESAMWDPKGLVRLWLEQHATILEDRNFVGIRVTHFRLP